MEITAKQRKDMLDAHNKLRNTISYIDDCRDITLSQIRDMEETVCILHQIGNFQPRKNEDGSSVWYADWVYAEDTELKSE